MRRIARVAAALLVLHAAHAAATEVLFHPTDRTKTIFPSDAFTVVDFGQNTFRRVNLAKPDCTANQVRCDDIDVLNKLDGFNPQPRITIPFSGPIDPATVSSESIFLVNLGSTVGHDLGGFANVIQLCLFDAVHDRAGVSEPLLRDVAHFVYSVAVSFCGVVW